MILSSAPFTGRAAVALAALLAAGAWLSPWSTARAAEPVRGTIELNRLEERAEGCRVWLLLRNPGADAHDKLRLDLLLFGRDGVIARRMLVDAGPLPADKTMARIFDAARLPCTEIGAVLLNDIPACGTPDCLSRFATSSRVPGVALDR